MLTARTAISSVHHPGAAAIRAGQLALAPGVHSAPAAAGTGHVRFPDRLGSSSAAAAAGQPGVGLHPKPPAAGAAYPRFRHFHDATS